APPEQTRDAPAGADAAGESHADPPPGPAPPAARGATEPAPGPLPVLQPGERAIVPQAVLLPPQLLGGLAGRPRARGARGTGRQAGERHLLPAHHGPPGPARAAPQRPPAASLDLAGTLTAAALRLAAGGPAGDHANPAPPARLRLRPADLRWRTPQAPAGVLFLLAVDASGSMARNRLGAAKGAALVLLERAYRHRDQVALIGVRGPEAQLLVPPTRSVARARRLLESLPAGGGTPLASALALSLAIAARAALTGHRQTLLVLLTDGRANVPLAGRAPAAHTAANVPLAGSAPAAHTAAEIAALAARWATLAATGAGATLVVDTRLRYLGDGAAVRLAAALGGRYLYLPQAGPGAVGAAAEATAQALGWRAAGANGPGG
ncbi:MAG TPA: VWA domain-containing protein, partial [Chloroflexia bacterium]|nr:VWA domain-containing protein [Chloroflexia bacterium]